MRASVARDALRLALASVCVTPGMGGSARADDSCLIEGTLEGIDVAIRLERGMRRVRLERPIRVAVTPIRSGIARVRTLEGDPIEGTTRAPLHFRIARPIALREATVELDAGMRVDRVDVSSPAPWARIDVALGDGLILRGAAVPCEMLAVGAEPAAVERARQASVPGPRWRARTDRIYLFDRVDGDGALRIDVQPESPARFVEVDRRGRWVRIVVQTARGARLSGWVHDEDLIR